MSVFRSSLRRAHLAWGSADGPRLETILGSVGDTHVPRIEDVVKMLGSALSAGQDAEGVKLEHTDSLLTDAIRCFMAHRWLAPAVQRKDASGNLVASFYMQPHQGAQMLSLFSSVESFERLQRDIALKGTILRHEQRTFCQVVMTDLPSMSVKTFNQRGIPESLAVRTLCLDPVPLLVTPSGEAPPGTTGVELSDAVFPLLKNLCESWWLAGIALEIAAVLEEEGLSAVESSKWATLFRTQSLVAIMAGGAAFVSDAGLLLFCFPGDAAKVLSFHQERKTAGLESAKVLPVQPTQLPELLQWQASRGGDVQVVTAALRDEGSKEVQCHSLKITSKMFLERISPALQQDE